MLLPSALGFSPHPPVSVYGTGVYEAIAAFLGTWLTCFATLVRSTSRLHIGIRFFQYTCYLACTGFSPFPAHAFHIRPHSSVHTQYRNLHLLSIDYVFRPRLRPRLTQSRSALLWKPWIFGRKDSHLPLATHSGILSSRSSTAPYRYSFYETAMLLYHSCLRTSPELRCRVLAPDIFGAGPLD